MFSAVLLLAVTATSLSESPLNTQLAVKDPVSLSVETQQATYFRGTLTSDQPLQKVVISGRQGNVVKQLISRGEQESEIFWFAPAASQYQLEIYPEQGRAAQVSLNLMTLPLKDDQTVSPDLPVLSPLLARTQTAIREGVQNAEAQFWQQVELQGTPLIEPAEAGKQLLTFLWKGDVSNVRVLGSPYEGHAHLARLPGSTIWYKSYVVPDDTRLSYRLAPNVPQLVVGEDAEMRSEQRRAVLATTQPDPLNHQPLFAQDDDHFGAGSTVTLAKALSDQVAQEQGNPKGRVTHHVYHSEMLGNERRISVYRPNEQYSLSPQAPLLIVFDGDAYLNRVSTPAILDNLMAEKKIPPMNAVFINNPVPSLRGPELTPNDQFADFMANEFKPYLCREQKICPSATDTILSGSSYGGLASMAIAFRHPQSFGKVLSLSGSFWWREQGADNRWMLEQVTQSQRKALEIYLSAGEFEQGFDGDGILDTNRGVYAALKDKGYPVTFHPVSGGHDYFAWRVMLADGLTQLFKSKP